MREHLLVAFALAGPAALQAQAPAHIDTPAVVTRTVPLQAGKSEMARAQAWGLDAREWQRYRTLMQGLRASISPSTISPIEVLGIHARNPAERRRYAEQWARAMHEDVERILGFERAYQAAYRRLYPNTVLIDRKRLVRHQPPAPLQASDRLLFFTRTDCPPCDVLLARVLKHQSRVAGIDLYIAGIEPGDDAGVRAWARARGIDPAAVHTRRITLNHAGARLEELTDGQGTVPYLLRERDDTLAVLRASEL